MSIINFECFENFPNSGCMSLIFPIRKALGPLPKIAEKIPSLFELRLNTSTVRSATLNRFNTVVVEALKFEPPRGKTNNVVSQQVRHKPTCSVIEAGYKLEILELSRGGIVLSE